MSNNEPYSEEFEDDVDSSFYKVGTYIDLALGTLSTSCFKDNILSLDNKNLFDEAIRTTMELLKEKELVSSYEVDSILMNKTLSIVVKVKQEKNSKFLTRHYKIYQTLI